VLQHVRKNPGQTPRTIRTSIDGYGVGKVDAAIERLVTAGRIECVTEEYENSRKQRRKKDVLMPVVVQEEGGE
jgi:hypothetical protein